jgi:hypothetical protein
MIALVCFVLAILISPFKSQARLEAENAALRQQLIILRRPENHKGIAFVKMDFTGMVALQQQMGQPARVNPISLQPTAS